MVVSKDNLWLTRSIEAVKVPKVPEECVRLALIICLQERRTQVTTEPFFNEPFVGVCVCVCVCVCGLLPCKCSDYVCCRRESACAKLSSQAPKTNK